MMALMGYYSFSFDIFKNTSMLQKHNLFLAKAVWHFAQPRNKSVSRDLDWAGETLGVLPTFLCPFPPSSHGNELN